MRARVCKALRSLDAQSIENRSAGPGTPDVNYIEGWIELKKAEKWPVQSKSVLRLPHFTQQQRVWLRRRWNAGGNAYVLLQVKNEFLLFFGHDAAEWLGRGTRQQLRDAAFRKWCGNEMDKEIAKCLSNRVS